MIFLCLELKKNTTAVPEDLSTARPSPNLEYGVLPLPYKRGRNQQKQKNLKIF